MATSSIFENVKITDPKKVDEFVAAMVEAANKPREKYHPSTNYVTDPDEIRTMAERWKAKNK